MRSHVEVQIGMIAKGQADKDAVVAHTLQQFRQKFLFFVAKVARMDALFEASFSPLASSGSPCHPPLTSLQAFKPLIIWYLDLQVFMPVHPRTCNFHFLLVRVLLCMRTHHTHTLHVRAGHCI